MSDACMKRLQNERKEWRKDHPVKFSAKPDSKPDGTTDLLNWTCTIPGKEGSCWEGGEYTVTLHFPVEYPVSPPIATFTPPLFHPNIFDGGQVCLSLLKASKDWAAGVSLKEILVGLQDLLTTPNPRDPANQKAAQMYTSRPQEYKRHAQELARKFRPTES